ncbi:MAG: bifunctional glutamate N-acetyltransferase/amino-acid acetyltransferase ArgJ [Thermoplasmatota archaeon]
MTAVSSTPGRVIAGGLANVPGIRAGGGHAGIKIRKPDVAMVYAEGPGPFAAAGVFTTNLVVAAPVVVSRARGRASRARAVVVNSGCANACTGEGGFRDAIAMGDAAATSLGLKSDEVLVASTGVIGQRLPMEKLLPGIKVLTHEVLAGKAGVPFAEAIMTTDTRPKEVLVEATIQGHPVRIGGAAKGSGMIHPNMATMLGFLATDAAIDPPALQQALEAATASTFNMITVDGDTSTNDSVFCLASGAAGGELIRPGTPSFATFQDALTTACRELAIAIARDGEGAKTLIEVRVDGASNVSDARAIARTIASSPLVKTAVTGRDPNWGRVLAAAGRSGVTFDPAKTELVLGSSGGRARVVKDGEPCETLGKNELRALMDKPEVLIILDLHSGSESATAWGCDLTHAYVDINADYTT